MEISNERREELLAEYLMHYRMVSKEEAAKLNVSELEFLIRAAQVHHEKKTMAADNFLMKADVFRQVCAERLNELEHIYAAWNEKTEYPHIMGDGVILIFSEKGYANHAREHYADMGLSLRMQEIAKSKRELFWADCHWWGMEHIVLDVGVYSTKLERDLLLPPPDFSGLSQQEIPVANPKLMFAMIRHRQLLYEEKRDEQWKQAEAYMCDRMLKEMVKAEFLCPVQLDSEHTQSEEEEAANIERGIGLRVALLTDAAGMKWLPVFTDGKAFRRVYDDKEWRVRRTSYHDVVTMAGENGFVVNPGAMETRVEENRRKVLEDYARRYERLQEEQASGRLKEKKPGLFLGMPAEDEENARLKDLLTAYMKKEKSIRKAYLTVKVERGDDISYYLVVEHKGDRNEVLGGIVRAVEGKLGCMRMDLSEVNDKTAELLADMEPFYKKGFLGL